MRFFLSIILAIFATTAAADPVFDTTLEQGQWYEIQRGEVDQWSLIVDAAGIVRLDLVHFTNDNGEAKTFFVARRPCTNGRMEQIKLYPGHISGIGLDCNGVIGSHPTFATWQGYLDDLPTDAQTLIQ